MCLYVLRARRDPLSGVVFRCWNNSQHRQLMKHQSRQKKILLLQENPGFVGPANWAETCLVRSLAVGFIPGAAERLHDPLPLPNHQLKEN